MLIDLLAEGFRASWLPSSLLLLVPGIAALLAAQERFSNTWLGYALAAGVVSWLRFTGIVGSWPLLGVALALAAAGVVLMAARVDTGRVVGSIGGLLANTVIGAYGTSKAASHHLVRNLAAEWGAKNVRVNAIAPGLVKTEFARALWEDEKRAAERIGSRLGRREPRPRAPQGAAEDHPQGDQEVP